MTHPNTGLIYVSQPKQLSKPVVIFFSLTQLILGLNFGFFNILRRNLRVLATFVSVLIYVVLTTLMWLPYHQIWPTFVSNAYYMWAFLVLQFSSYSLYKFLVDMLDIDLKWNLVAKGTHVGFKTLLFASVLMNISLFGVHIYQLLTSLMGWVEMFSAMAQHTAIAMYFISSLVNVFVYYQVYLRIDVLKSLLEAKKIRITDAVSVFKSLADCLAKIRVLQDKMVGVGFAVHFLLGVFIIGIQFELSVLEKKSVLRQINTMFQVLEWFMGIALPAVSAEIMASKADEMKMVIHDRLLTETDGDVEEDLERLLRYVEARQLLRKAWRLVPVDLRQPVALLSMSVTYLIVILQFQHVF